MKAARIVPQTLRRSDTACSLMGLVGSSHACVPLANPPHLSPHPCGSAQGLWDFLQDRRRISGTIGASRVEQRPSSHLRMAHFTWNPTLREHTGRHNARAGPTPRPIGVELLNVSAGVNPADLPETDEIARLLVAEGVKVLTAPARKRTRRACALHTPYRGASQRPRKRQQAHWRPARITWPQRYTIRVRAAPGDALLVLQR